MRLHPTGRFDNGAREYDHLTAVPLAAAMGAEIRGIQIGELTDEQFPEIEEALFRHKMIFLRDQAVSLRDQESFTRRFGEFGIDAYTKGAEGHENVQPVIKEAGTRTKLVFGSGWHTDSPFLETPPAISMLYCAETPPYGGDTIWSNTALAYGYLSETMKRVLAPLRVHMTAVDVVGYLSEENQGNQGRTALGDMALDIDTRKMIDGTYHPLVRTHPRTGEKSLYVDHTYAHGIEGMTDAEAEGLLGFLKDHVTEPAFTCRLRWEPKTFAMWDNRGCIHRAFNDYDGFRREMYRTTVLGEVPA